MEFDTFTIDKETQEIEGSGIDGTLNEFEKFGQFTIVDPNLVQEGKKWKATFDFEYADGQRKKSFDLKVNFFQGVAEGTYTHTFNGEIIEEGAVKIVQLEQPALKLTLKYKDDPTRPNENYHVKVDFDKMEFATDDEARSDGE
jgi:hypothetical protein